MQKNRGAIFRAFPLSNWTELDMWQYIYLANVQPVVERGGSLIVLDDECMPLAPGENQ